MVLLDGREPPTLSHVALLAPVRQLTEILLVEVGHDGVIAALEKVGTVYDETNKAIPILGLADRGGAIGFLPALSDGDDVEVEESWRRELLGLLDRSPGATLAIDIRFIMWHRARRLLMTLGGLRNRLSLVVITHSSMCVDCVTALLGTNYPNAQIEERRVVRLADGSLRADPCLHEPMPEHDTADKLLQPIAQRLFGVRRMAGGFDPELMQRRHEAGRHPLRVYTDTGPFGASLRPLLGGANAVQVADIADSVGGGFDRDGRDPWCIGSRGSITVRVAADHPAQLLALGLRFPPGRPERMSLRIAAKSLLSGQQVNTELEVTDARNEWVVTLPIMIASPVDIIDLYFIASGVLFPSFAPLMDRREISFMVDTIELWPVGLACLSAAFERATAKHSMVGVRSLPPHHTKRSLRATGLPSPSSHAIIDVSGRGINLAAVSNTYWLPLQQVHATEVLHIIFPDTEPRRLSRMLGDIYHIAYESGYETESHAGHWGVLHWDESPELLISTAETIALTDNLTATLIGFNSQDEANIEYRWTCAAVSYVVLRSRGALGSDGVRVTIAIASLPNGLCSASIPSLLRDAHMEAYDAAGRQFHRQRLLDSNAQVSDQPIDIIVPSGELVTLRFASATVNLAKLGISKDERDIGLLIGLPTCVLDSKLDEVLK
ncbi:hypothetical protein SAMN04488125_1456 [Methylorubrum salsuginis]|uniref:Uncharacterized protein n=2 Tax=Methylorubrum salsuginis TaxID=414703 RepID=A0A1I4MV94_9HYPH|nr:hypothetical protein SAMN04488125_1456 [Methylorubrum salsuginis]